MYRGKTWRTKRGRHLQAKERCLKTKPYLPIPLPWTSRIQNCGRIDFYYLSHPVSGMLWQHQKTFNFPPCVISLLHTPRGYENYSSSLPDLANILRIGSLCALFLSQIAFSLQFCPNGFLLPCQSGGSLFVCSFQYWSLNSGPTP
jgi:hypothetical protein